MIAAGTYLRTLRETLGLSRIEVAVQAGTNEVQIMRIEKGEIDTRGSLLMAFVDAVRGSSEHIKDLLLSKEATEEDGRRLAELQLTHDQHRQIADIIATHGPDRVQRVVVQLKQLSRDELMDALAQALADRQRPDVG